MTHPDEGRDPDYRFSLANERTFLAWLRTAFAFLVGGVAAAKALHFNHDIWRWVVAAPPIIAGAWTALEGAARWRQSETAMRTESSLPVGRGLTPISIGVCTYAIVALVAIALDG